MKGKIALAIIIISCILYYLYKENFTFFLLHLSRRNGEAALIYANELMKSERGVDLAFKDFNIFGGETRSFSSYILINSKIPNINDRLNQLVISKNVDYTKKFEACYILWSRTNDCIHFEKYFNLIIEFNNKTDKKHIVSGAIKNLVGKLLRASSKSTFDIISDKPTKRGELLFVDLIDKYKHEFGTISVENDKIWGISKIEFKKILDDVICSKTINVKETGSKL